MLSRTATLLVLVSVAAVASGPLRSGAHGPAFVAPSLLPGLRLSPATSASTQLDKARSQRAFQRGARFNGVQMGQNPWDKMFKGFSDGIQQTLSGGSDPTRERNTTD